MKTVNATRVLDYGLAAGSLAYGLYAQSVLWLAGGFLGLVLAWFNPGKRIKDFLFIRLRRKDDPKIAPAAAFPRPPTTPYRRRSNIEDSLS